MMKGNQLFMYRRMDAETEREEDLWNEVGWKTRSVRLLYKRYNAEFAFYYHDNLIRIDERYTF